LEKLNKIDKPLVKLIKRRKEKTQIQIIRTEKGDVTTDTDEIQKTIREYFKDLYSNKLENLEETYKFLDTYGPPKLNQKDIHNLNRSLTNNEIMR
jgi:hypothetical protein